MAQRVDSPPSVSATPRSPLAQTRLLLGAAVAAIGFLVAFQRLGLPGTHLTLSHNGQRTDSVAALDRKSASAPRHSARRRSAETGRASGGQNRRREVGRKGAKTAPGSVDNRTQPGKHSQPTPTPSRPGSPGSGTPSAGGGTGSASSQSPDKTVTPPPPPSSPPPPSPPPQVQVPQLPQLPQAPSIPVPTVPDLPAPEVPTVPTPQLPPLP
jgi:hypothetical protein